MPDNEDLIKRLKKFIGLTFLVFFLALVAGAVGGWLIYDTAEAGSKISGVELLIPTVIAAVVAGVIMLIVRKKLFASKEELQKAVELFKEQNGQGKKD